VIQFKDKKQEAEFNNFEVVDARLYALGHALAQYVENTMQKDIVITCVKDDGISHRTSSSPHVINERNPRVRAFDMRVHFDTFTSAEKLDIMEWLSLNFPRSDMHVLEMTIPGWYGCVRHHGDEATEHFHITVEERKAYRRQLLG